MSNISGTLENELVVNRVFALLTPNEKFGLQFGMFPADKVKGMTREQTIMLMQRVKQERENQ